MRGTDELLSAGDSSSSPTAQLQGHDGTTMNTTTTTTTTNGSVSPTTVQQQNGASENNNDAKKVKLENGVVTNSNGGSTGQRGGGGPNQPSKVVHIRNVPPDATESDLINLGIPFGRVTNVLLLKGKNQAFLEFADVHCAQQMVNYWFSTTLVGGVATPAQPTIRGRHVFCQFSNHKELKTGGAGGGDNSSIATSSPAGSGSGSSPTHAPLDSVGGVMGGSSGCSVLRVIVDNLVYPVTLDILYQIFSRIGKVTKIVTFTKNSTFQALIQYENPLTAQTAKLTLDGQNIFNSCNTLRIEYSKLSNLNVKYNNDKSRDFTNPTLPPGTTQPGALGAAQTQMDPLLDPLTLAALPALGNLGFGTGAGLPHFAGLRAALGPQALSQSAQAAAQLQQALGLGTVLLVSNLNDQMTSPDALFTLFGVYGDVMRVKILFNKKDNALIQMAEPQQSQLAMTYLDRIKLFGKIIRVTQSKHQLVQMPKEGQHQDAGLTKDYGGSPLHRFKKPGSKNYANIYPPSATLHLSNIPPTCTEEDIRNAFQQCCGAHVVNFKFFPKDRKMALIQLPTTEDAIHALIKMHNYQLSDSSHLRVSFSKSSI